MITPAEALDCHVELLARLQEEWLPQVIQLAFEQDSTPAFRESSADAVRSVTNHIRVAQTFLIDESMSKLARYQMPTRYSKTEKFGDCTIPASGCGLLLCEEPLRSLDRKGREEVTHLMSWGPARFQDVSGLLLVQWNDARREPAEVLRSGPESESYVDLVRRHGGVTPLTFDFWRPEDRIGPSELQREGAVTGSWNVARWLFGVWALMAETVSASELVRPPRPAARRAERAKVLPTVNVVTLRHEAREVMDPGSGTPLQWRSRVSGHWRNQPCGPGFSEVRRIWISDHERGPEAAPYRPSKGTVYRLAR